VRVQNDNQPHTKSNPNPNRTTKQHAVVSIFNKIWMLGYISEWPKK